MYLIPETGGPIFSSTGRQKGEEESMYPIQASIRGRMTICI
jgi:hypothetical protein